MKKISIIFLATFVFCSQVHAKGIITQKEQFEKSFCGLIEEARDDKDISIQCPLRLIKKEVPDDYMVDVYNATLQDGSTIEIDTKKNSSLIKKVIYVYESRYDEVGDSNNVIMARGAILDSINKGITKNEKYYHFISSRRAYRASQSFESNKMSVNGISYTLTYDKFTENRYVLMIENI